MTLRTIVAVEPMYKMLCVASWTTIFSFDDENYPPIGVPEKMSFFFFHELAEQNEH
jgi:hypothetical protein